ncbi:MAG: alpha/beta hydrolase [Alphaproteobacteria bacterium]|nr:alpha/beta hydrolase [Alphaproteobacteria bacterium]MCB9793700.1 alpha/beta hydrolase [Alphaproteobacteria bacterium]
MSLALLLWGALGCADRRPGDDYFFFRRDGADMPVWVRGDPDSRTMLVYLQGGPGNPTAVVDAMFPELAEDLDARYRTVYWDQRASGGSLGQAPPESLTPEGFAQDLDLLTELLLERYEVERLVLWGISWGGTLGNQFLSEPERAAKVAGWVELDGGENMEMAYALSRPRVMDFAEARIAAGEDIAYWEEALAWYEAHPTQPAKAAGLQHYEYVYEAGGYWYDAETAGFDGLAAYFFKGSMGVTWLGNQAWIDREMQADVNIHDRVPDITTPALLLWGRHDLVVPLEVGERTFELLGTPAEDKRFVVIEEAAHTVIAEQPERVAQEMNAFIEGL